MSVLDPTPWRQLRPAVAEALAARLEAVVDDIAHGVRDTVPDFAGIEDPRLLRDARQTALVSVTRFVELVGTTEPALTTEVREVFVSLGAAEAREDRGPDAIVAAMRTASRLLLHQVIAALTERGAVTTDQVVALADATGAFGDELATACTDGFAMQLQVLAGERDRRRQHLAELLLTGGAPASVVTTAAQDVGWSGVDRVVPVLLPIAEARETRFRFAEEGLVVERGRDVLAIVRDVPRTDLLGPRLRGRGAVVGPAVAWPDLPEAVRLTEVAARTVPISSGSPLVVEQHLATLALRGEPAALVALSRRRLAPFADLPAGQRRAQLATLASWLRHWGARGPVAEELFVHPQTVSYRIRRVRALLGDDLDDPVARFELQLVLAGELSAPPVAP